MSADLLHPDPLRERPPSSAGDGASDTEEADPELLALPPPARGQRQLTVGLLLVVSLVGSAMAYSLRGDAAYALAPAAEIDLADLYAFDAAHAAPNRFVRAHGTLGGALAVRFERPFESDTYRVSPVMGRRDVWVEVRVPAGEEGGRYVPPTSFNGRLVRWSESGLRHRGLQSAVDSLTHEAVPPDGWLLIDGEAPRSARWALGLAAMFAGFALWGVVTLARLVRRVR